MSNDPLVIWVNPEEFELCQTKPIIMDEHNELLNGMPRQIAAIAARTDHCSLALMPATPPAAQVQGEREAFDCWFRREEGLPDSADTTYISAAYLPWKAWQARAALSAPPAAGVPEGWKLVPMEPTAVMQVAGAAAIRFETTPINKLFTGNAVYRAAISAAPTPPASEQQQAGEPVGYCDDHVLDTILHGRAFSVGVTPAQHRRGGENNALYTAPPVSEQQRAVVMPERLPVRLPQGRDLPHGYAEAWNACLTELLRLNPHLAGVNQGVTTEAGNGGEV